MLFHHRAVEARLANIGCLARIRTRTVGVKTRYAAVTPRGNELVEPEVVATSPCPGKNRMPVCCGFDSRKVTCDEWLVTRSRRTHWPPLVTCHMSLSSWFSRRDLHPHWQRSRRRASELGYASCWRSATKWILQPVLPRTRRAYETHLSAGSTAMLAHGHQKKAPTRSCTGLIRLPSECIADNALGA